MNAVEEMKQFLRDNPSIPTTWTAYNDLGNTTRGEKVCCSCGEDHNEIKNAGRFAYDYVTKRTRYFCWDCFNTCEQIRRRENEIADETF